ncbi:hypothetical protein F1B92_05550 [Campylobacter sp. FMV-PI01]|uniref:F0F1 ATP synthase subunit B n=1 Tax=Campylobacter portucalensis TaxID=2608384 RepID=A0A6L5WLE1_9BACT|nr:hypothetical protein [Campylobacter portucalensis]MSN96633.1 hypothetical protein [Campylobacter portucalensis]
MIEIDVSAFILTIVVFLMLVWYLNRRLYQPMLSFMDAREAAIFRDEELANKNLSDVGSSRAEVEKILSIARGEANKKKQDALDEIKKESQNEIKEKIAEFESDFVSYMQNLNLEKENLKSALNNEIPKFKNQIKEKLARI